LARSAAFSLGPLTIDPSTRQITDDGRSQTVEPRVMRVLVALGEKPGQVLSRDELIELCWDGQLVTDNAVTRVISLLRHALERSASFWRVRYCRFPARSGLSGHHDFPVIEPHGRAPARRLPGEEHLR
jgi:DNA-binding response OmpR family regulator